jgi:hypothetical protein
MTPKATNPEASRAISWVLAILITLPVLYILSVGPISKLADEFASLQPSLNPVIEVVYAPLTAAMDHSPAFRDFVFWYVFDVWHIPFSKPP